jgi:hypothetical protein
VTRSNSDVIVETTRDLLPDYQFMGVLVPGVAYSNHREIPIEPLLRVGSQLPLNPPIYE